LSFFWAFYRPHFSALLFLYLLPFSRKSTSIFVLIDPCPEVKPIKKNTQNKTKKISLVVTAFFAVRLASPLFPVLQAQ